MPVSEEVKDVAARLLMNLPDAEAKVLMSLHKTLSHTEFGVVLRWALRAGLYAAERKGELPD